MQVQWYPGHMAKAKREMFESLKLVDIVFELLDARIPLSSRNPDIDLLCTSKPRIVLLNKSDLADKSVNKLWQNYFKMNNLICLEIDSLTGRGTAEIIPVIRNMFKDRDKKLKEKGIISKPIRAMIVGIPNVGKSSLINRMSGKASTKTGNKPGVTKGRQWIKLNNVIELLDTPGILWPKFEDEEVGLKLAFTGAIKDEIIEITELAIKLIDRLKESYSNKLSERYKLSNIDRNTWEIINEIGKNRSCILQGGIIDTERVAKIVIEEFRMGKLGKISLERPELK